MAQDPNDFYGHLVELEPIEGVDTRRHVRDPSWRYAALVRGDDVVVVDISTNQPEIVRVFRAVGDEANVYALHPSGEFLAVRDQRTHTLSIHDADGAVVTVETDTITLDWRGELVPFGESDSPWGYADDKVFFDGAGEHVLLMAHDQSGRPRVTLHRVDTLEVVDALDTIRLEPEYPIVITASGEPRWRDLEGFRGCEVEQESWSPDTLIGYSVSGDTFVGVFCVRIDGGRVRQLHADTLMPMLTTYDHHPYYTIRISPRGELIAETDLATVARFPWPPEVRREPLAECMIASLLYPNCSEVLPLFESSNEFEFEPTALVSMTPDHVLESVNQGVFMIALEPTTLEVLGVVRGVERRSPNAYMFQLGHDLFISQEGGALRMWRLARS